MSDAMRRRIARLEGEQSPGVLWVIIRHWAAVNDPAPRWMPESRLVIVYEGHEHLGEELLTSLGVPWERSDEVEARQQSVDEGSAAF
jgi:hypothetical protein